jgi:hypothetical protein
MLIGPQIKAKLTNLANVVKVSSEVIYENNEIYGC